MRILLTALAMVMSVSAFAETKIAVLDAQGVVAQANAAKRANEILKIDAEEAQKELDKMKEKIKKQDADLVKKKSVLSEAKYKEQEDLLKKDVKAYYAEVQASEENLQRRRAELRQPILDAMRDVTREIAQKEKYTVILPLQMTHFHEDSINITEEVLKRVNKKLDK